MQIANIRRLDTPPSPRGFKCLARFNLEISPDLILYDFEIIRGPAGDFAVYSPPGRGTGRVAGMSQDFRQKVARLVISELDLQKDEHGSNAIA